MLQQVSQSASTSGTDLITQLLATTCERALLHKNVLATPGSSCRQQDAAVGQRILDMMGMAKFEGNCIFANSSLTFRNRILLYNDGV